jgi:hypothetical protein
MCIKGKLVTTESSVPRVRVTTLISLKIMIAGQPAEGGDNLSVNFSLPRKPCIQPLLHLVRDYG